MASVKESIGDFSWTSTPHKSDTDTAATDKPDSRVQNRTITLAHFTHALGEILPSSSVGSHSELRQWHDKFGRKRTLDDSNYSRPQTNGVNGTGSQGGATNRADGRANGSVVTPDLAAYRARLGIKS